MSAVGIVSIAVGVLTVCARIPLVVVPAAALRWFKGVIKTNGRIRALGAFALLLGATMIWAGASGDSALAGILLFFGFGIVAMSTLVLLPFPSAYRALANEFLPADPRGRLIGWRMAGLAGVIVGGLLIYFGALALTGRLNGID